MASFNKVILAGNLTADPEKRYIPSGTAVAELRMAVNERYKKGDEWVETPVYVSVEVWDRQAETCCQYLSKGSGLLVEGRLKFDQWEDKDGGKRSKLSVRGERVQFLGSAGGRDGAAGGAPAASGSAPVKAPAPPAADEDDDLPF